MCVCVCMCAPHPGTIFQASKMYTKSSITTYIVCLVWCVGGHSGDDGRGSVDCISCLGDPKKLDEQLKAQKTAQRLEYIKQQLIANLHMETPPKDPPKLNTLPAFLVEQIMTDGQSERSVFESAKKLETKQVVLFPEEETKGYHPLFKHSICLTFRLNDELFSEDLISVSVWLKKAQFSGSSSIQNLTVSDKNALMNARNRNRRSKIHRVQESNGWYRVEVSSTVKLWQNNENLKIRTLVISCDDCHLSLAGNSSGSSESFLLFNIEKETNFRSKRGVDCVPGNNECCRDNLEVDFNSLGYYDTVIYPKTFNAYVCRGACHNHSFVDTGKPYAGLLVKLKEEDVTNNLPTSCCTPTKLSSLSVAFASSNSSVEILKIPNMVVESCGCI